MSWELALGARPRADGVDFRVWAPDRKSVEVVIYTDGSPATSQALQRDAPGYWSGHITGLQAGARYMYRLDGTTDRPDPASRHQPDGVHGPSMVVDPNFGWTDQSWRGLPREDLVVYELHVGAATTDGTFEALIERLANLRELGITAIELMPVADFPGDRNWGYDGVDLYAPARAYGGVDGLKRLVDAAHAHGLAVILDAVYNHLGPAGNYLRDYSPRYFTDRHHTPWGEALNFDGPGSREVREFFVANALHWAHEYHFDGLRLDATHAIIDDSPVHILQEIAERVRASLPPDRRFLLIAEDGRNEARLVRPTEVGGYGLDAVWADDLHHTVRVTLTGENDGYYRDYARGAEEIAATLRGGWLFQGQPAPRTGEPRGTPAGDLPVAAFVHCIQNHDQVGNRALGERLHHDVSPAAYRAASALLLLSPYIPMLFMGQEWAASSPFLFFTDHDPDLGRLVTEGRRREFKHFSAFAHAEVPDPQAADTFRRSKLDWAERTREPHAGALRLYRDLLALRMDLPALRDTDRGHFDVRAVGNKSVALRRGSAVADQVMIAIVNLGEALDLAITEVAPGASGLRVLLDTEGSAYADGSAEPDPHHRPNVFDGERVTMGGPGALVLAGGTGT